jgi:hypothetical protein
MTTTIRAAGKTRLHVTRSTRHPGRTELAIEGKYGDGAGILLDAGEVAELITALQTAGGAR